MKKPVSAATRALLDSMEEEDAAPSEDKLDRARAAVAMLRDAEAEAAQLDSRLSEVNQNIKSIKEQTLVDLFDEAGIDRLGIPARGNLPPYDVEVAEWMRANIPAARAGDAYEYLHKTGHADLIKTTFVVEFGLRESGQAGEFEKLLQKRGVQYSRKQGVPWNTLTAWLKVEHKRKPLPGKVMEMLGATVGRIAKVVKQKEKK